jgi:hypothetical protein
MQKMIFATLICLAILSVSFSQTAALLHRFQVSDDIDSISTGIKVPKISVSHAQDIITNTNTACLNSGCGVTPVQLILLNAKRISNKNVDVFWETTNEINNKGFEVQRSLGNTSAFTKRGFVPADDHPAFKHKYNFDDENDYENISYYRLKQIDIDNNFIFSKIVSVKGYASEEMITVYPNPAKITVLMDVTLQTGSMVTISLYDNKGHLLNEKSDYLDKGTNTRNIQVGQFAKGMYTIKVIKNDGKQLTATFIKN